MSHYCKDEEEKVLLVEGKNDCHVVLALWNSSNLPRMFGVYECENDDGVLKRLNALIPSPTPIKAIGIVLDADKPDVLGRWDQIKTKIKGHGYKIPKNPNPEGTIIHDNSGKPIIGIWLMPNNRDQGMLEDFLLGFVDHAAIDIASHCIEAAVRNKIATFKENHYSKALIHTYLSWQDEPGKPLGQSITSHVLQPQNEIAHIFVAWLKRLFETI